MKTIIINSKKYGVFNVFVDDEDFDLVNKYTWHVQTRKTSDTVYASTTINNKHILMHRLILSSPISKIIDHKDHNGLNNQKFNLRNCTFSENSKNKRPRKNGSSKYLGVHIYKGIRKFHNKNGIRLGNYNSIKAIIKVNGKNMYLGQFKTEEAAALAYNIAAKKYHGEFASLNTFVKN